MSCSDELFLISSLCIACAIDLPWLCTLFFASVRACILFEQKYLFDKHLMLTSINTQDHPKLQHEEEPIGLVEKLQ